MTALVSALRCEMVIHATSFSELPDLLRHVAVLTKPLLSCNSGILVSTSFGLSKIFIAWVVCVPRSACDARALVHCERGHGPASR